MTTKLGALALAALALLALHGCDALESPVEFKDNCVQVVHIMGDFDGTITQEGCPEGEIEDVPPCWTSTQSKNRLPESECKECLRGNRDCAWRSDFFDLPEAQYIFNGEPLIQ